MSFRLPFPALQRTNARTLEPLLGSFDDVVAARDVRPPRRPRRLVSRRREIIAVIDPVWPAPDDVTASVRADQESVQAVARHLVDHLDPGEVAAATDDGRLRLRLWHDDKAARPVRLQAMAYHCVEAFAQTPTGAGQLIDLGVGWASVPRGNDAAAAERQARAAADESIRQRDLQPRHHDGTRRGSSVRISLRSASTQIMLATIGSIVLPFLALVGLHHIGIDLSGPLYWALVAALMVTAATIWSECVLALEPPEAPTGLRAPAPRASAVIAAYLPNEADTIVETLHTFLAQEYSGGLQVVLAYNTPTPLPVEEELRRLDREHPDLDIVKVPDSTSKAQNVNAALRVADGAFVGIFDADHHPMPGAFDRAWRWLAPQEHGGGGHDVVQGHCVIRNGEDSALAKLVAVEFEQIYAVSHPGRAALHQFGIFGGSNGYWRADALERIRLRGSYLTEDIEASMRVLEDGGSIVNDPGLISRELAPETPKALWKQRMRWAQGWFQVSMRHLGPILRASHLSLRQKVGATYLLGWREVYPWISLMAWPLFGFLAWRDGGLDLTSPLFGLITLFIMVSGPLQTLAAWRLATPEIRRHRSWFLGSMIANLLLYTEAKNLVNRVAHLKQLRGEHQWVVTPRTSSPARAEAALPEQADHEEVAA